MTDVDSSLELATDCHIPVDEVGVRADPSGGPGGQHANRSATRITVTFDVAGSPSLSADQRHRIIEKLGAVVTVSVDDTRSQARNRELAFERLRQRLAGALVRPKPRRATRPSKGAVERRLEQKRRQSLRKAQRRDLDDR